MLNLMGVLNATAANVSCTCNCKRYTSLQSMEISEYALCFSDFCPLLFRLRGRSLFLFFLFFAVEIVMVSSRVFHSGDTSVCREVATPPSAQ